jgi:hypothetical protein
MCANHAHAQRIRAVVPPALSRSRVHPPGLPERGEARPCRTRVILQLQTSPLASSVFSYISVIYWGTTLPFEPIRNTNSLIIPVVLGRVDVAPARAMFLTIKWASRVFARRRISPLSSHHKNTCGKAATCSSRFGTKQVVQIAHPG